MLAKIDNSLSSFEPVLNYLSFPETTNLRQSCLFFYENSYLLFKYLQGLKEFEAKKELENIFKNQKVRFNSLIRDFSQIPKETKAVLLEKVPLLELSQSNPNLIAQALDEGRANSFIFDQPFYCSFFNDKYHREAHLDTQSSLRLVSLSCRIEFSGNSNSIYIPVFAPLRFLINAYFTNKTSGLPIFNLVSYALPFKGFSFTQEVFLLKSPKELHKETLKELGNLGALPNRDWQLQYFVSKNGDSVKISYLYDKYKTRISCFHLNDFTPKTIELVCPSEKKSAVINQLNKALTTQDSSFQTEQRQLYLQLLLNLIEPIEVVNEPSGQMNLAWHRIDDLLQNNLELSYTNFLRTIETVLDEVLILYTLSTKSKASVAEISDSVKQFILKTVGVLPQSATLRTSAMQAIWQSFQLALHYFSSQAINPSLFVSKFCYFEIFTVLNELFKLNLKKFDSDLRLKIDISIMGTENLPHSEERIYDIYIDNFESNVLVHRNQIQYSDLPSFIKKQMKLRQNLANRPLFLILDNTMSNFDESYLPAMLNQFQEVLQSGLLAVLVIHSGNKYLHVGTDKALAALFYAYYNPQHLPLVEKFFQSDSKANKLGDFEPNSPTVLFTQAYLDHCLKIILNYAPFLRQRTAFVFNYLIPKELLCENNYFSIDYPFSNANPINYCGLITVKSHENAFCGGTIHAQIIEDLNRFLYQIGIHARDGFGFSETTRVGISSPGYSTCLRLSIGTEALDFLAQKIQFLCNYLLAVNSVMENYRLDMGQNFFANPSLILAKIKQKLEQLMLYARVYKLEDLSLQELPLFFPSSLVSNSFFTHQPQLEELKAKGETLSL